MLNFVRFFSVVMAVMVFLSGCGVKAKAYITRRERVDQDVAVYPGTSKANASAEAPKKTRQVIVVEISRDKKEKQSNDSQTVVAQKPAEDNAAMEPIASKISAPSSSQLSAIHSGSVDVAASAAPETISYTVQKDDTLQKIAKQFLGSYSQWTKIYESNRDKIKDPNFLKAGIVLSIPKQ